MISYMNKKFLGTLVVLAIIGSSLSIPAHASVKAGATCKTKGQVKTVSNLKYSCIKFGNKLVWNLGGSGLSPKDKKTSGTKSNVSSLPIAYEPPSDPSDNIESCKINELSNRRGFTWAGFPLKTALTRNSGTVKWALIPIDFKNLPGEKDFRTRINRDMKLVSDWFEIASEGKFKVEWVVAEKWTTLPGVSSDYQLIKTRGVNNTQGGIKLFKAAMAASDPNFDFTNVQTVNFILPANQGIASVGEQGFPWDQHVKDYVTNEGPISSFTTAGKYQTMNKKSLWNYWIHEFGHAIGLPHVGGNGPERSPFHDWDILGDQDGTSRELSGWLRFLAGWLAEEKIYCKDAKNVDQIDITLVPLGVGSPGIKMAIFPLSPTKAVIVESRRETKFSCTTSRNGVLVYMLDLTLGHGQDFLVPISAKNRNLKEKATCSGVLSDLTSDPLLRLGDKVKFDGVTVEVLESKDMDRIRISKTY